MSIGFQKVSEFHFILPTAQVPQALQEGLSGGFQLEGTDSSAEKVRSYVRLFFNGNNPVLRQMLRANEDLCVLKISVRALSVPGAVIADRDVLDPEVSLYLAEGGVKKLNFSVLGQKDGWTDRKCSVAENLLRGKQRSASLLVPDAVPKEAILGIYVASEKVRNRVLGLFRGEALRPLIVNPPLFFSPHKGKQELRKVNDDALVGLKDIVPPHEGEWDYGGPEEEDLGFGRYVEPDEDEEEERDAKIGRDRFESEFESSQRKAKRQKLRSSSSSSEGQ